MYPTTPDERAIYEQEVGYCRLVDDGDFDGAARLCARATVKTSEGVWHGEAEVRHLLAQIRLYDGRPRTKHLLSVCDIQFAEHEEAATALVYVLVLQATDDLPLRLVQAKRFADVFLKDGDRWYLSTRDASVGELDGDLRHHVAVAGDRQ